MPVQTEDTALTDILAHAAQMRPVDRSAPGATPFAPDPAAEAPQETATGAAHYDGFTRVIAEEHGRQARGEAPPRPNALGAGQARTACSLLATGLTGFADALRTTLLRGRLRDGARPEAVVTRPFAYACRAARQLVAVVVPRGFVTDFASIPRWLTALLPPDGRYAEAAVVHDWLYAIGTPGDQAGRRRADILFAVAMRESGVGWFVRALLFLGVRLGGMRDYGSLGEWRFADPSVQEADEPIWFDPPFSRTRARDTLFCADQPGAH